MPKCLLYYCCSLVSHLTNRQMHTKIILELNDAGLKSPHFKNFATSEVIRWVLYLIDDGQNTNFENTKHYYENIQKI